MVYNIGRFVREGDSLLNVGAQFGLETILYGIKAGNKGSFFFFQPYSVSYLILKKNVYLNGLQHQTKVYKVAGSNKKEKGYMMVDNGNTARNTIDGQEDSSTFGFN